MKTKVYPVDEKHPAYWPTGPLIRFLRPEKAVRCVACGKKTKKHWTMLCPFRAVIFEECTLEIKAERFPVQRPGTAVCDDHPLHPELPVALIGCGEGLLPERDAPRIVCLCGSTRFSEAFQAANLRETLAGNIVLTIGCDMKSDAALGLPPETKAKLDELHLRKIDLADEVLILNVGGYIGESTHREMVYAAERRKGVRFLERSGGLAADKTTPYVPAWQWPGKGLLDGCWVCRCGHHEGYHNDNGRCCACDCEAMKPGYPPAEYKEVEGV